MSYIYTIEDIVLLNSAGYTQAQVDAVIGQFTDKGVHPIDCSLDFLGKQARAEDTTGLLALVETVRATKSAAGESLNLGTVIPTSSTTSTTGAGGSGTSTGGGGTGAAAGH